ncbi:MAG: hypothetical protein JNL21_32645 [Myxococcales bacterium]|nr:hypothetical protein [Myxococcales bacterium]
MRRRALLGLAAALSLAASCTADDGPVDPVWGKQPCAHCAMLVSEQRFAAQALEDDGTRTYFDDVGCLALWSEDKRPARAWARDGAEQRWIDVGSALFRAGEHTPMSFGYVIDMARGDLGWDAVRASVRTRGRQ